jgi:predicted exporter
MALIWIHPPPFEYSGEALRPRESPSFAALEELKKNLGRKSDPLWMIVSGKNEQEVADRLQLVRKTLGSSTNHQLTLPDKIWPNPAWQMANRPQLDLMERARPQIRSLLVEHGFASNTMNFTDGILAGFSKPKKAGAVFWPEGPLSEWILDKSASRGADEFEAIGFLEIPEADTPRKIFEKVRALERQFAGQPIWFAGWEHLGVALQEMVKSKIWKVTLPMVALLLICLTLAYRSWQEVLLSLMILAFSLLMLSALMQLFGWSWNLLNIMSLPLLLGAGVDYSIHMQMAMRRRGEIRAARRGIGRALLLCAATNVTGFGSLAWSGNAGLASLGQVCAAGILIIYLASVFVLPSWWMRLVGPGHAATA